MAVNEIMLPAQSVRVAGEYDVVVCGGGPAGVGAAIAAGRLGRRVLLIEMQSRLGGLMAAVPYFCDSPGGPIFDELIERLLELDAAHLRVDRERFHPPGRYAIGPHAAAAILLEMVRGAGVELLLGTVAESAWLDDGAAAGVLVVNKAGRSLVRARVVIDCTADADIAASAGTPFRQGDPDDGRIQHGNFRWSVKGIDSDSLPSADRLEALCREAVAGGAIRMPDAVYGFDPACFPFRHGSLVLGGWELLHVDPTDPVQTTEALVQCQLAGLQILRFLRERVAGCAECRMESPGTFAPRESRRIEGLYTVTGADVLAGAKFEDGVAPAWFYTDLHDPPPGPAHTWDYILANQPPPGDWYEIPYRCLVPVEPPGLLVAGRCISAERLAHGSLRIMPTCIFLGQAAGTAAARAVEAGVRPHELDGAALKAELLADWRPPVYPSTDA
ncbi:MAG TPA: hypothetical protein DGT21_09190 [Armatimonadetes bacterium]|nr:hypothetical protein [Armatimonadota bacterium]